MSPIEQGEQLLRMAAKDIKALDLMLQPESVEDEIFGFHAQQAVEKSLKAWITAIGGGYGYVHDLRILLLTLRDLGCAIEPFRHLVKLNPFAVQLRYEPLETSDVPLDRQALRAEVQEIHDHVLAVLALLKARG
jgi:HEPN domain-containing protein